MSFSFNGFRILPGKGLIAGIVVILALGLGLAGSLSMALKTRDKVIALEQILKASEARIEALKGIVETQRAAAYDAAATAAKTQGELSRAQNRIRQAGSAVPAVPDRVRAVRDQAQRELEQLRSHGPSADLSGGAR